MNKRSWYSAFLAATIVAPFFILAGCDVTRDEPESGKVDTREVRERPEPSNPSLDKQL